MEENKENSKNIKQEQGSVTSKVGIFLETVETKKGKDTSKKESVAPSSIVEETGINLIPTMSKEDIVVEERKKKVNTGSLISLSLLFSVTILVVGFNIISRIQLNTQKSKVQAKERSIKEYSQIISSNTEILERVFLYEDVQKGRISTTKVLDYFRNAAASSGNNVINSFVFPGTGGFEFNGEGTNLEDISKFWYLLSNDEKLERIDLRSFSRGRDSARFTFSGTLKEDEFIDKDNI